MHCVLSFCSNHTSKARLMLTSARINGMSVYLKPIVMNHIYITIISRVPDQNGVSLLCIILKIHHSGQDPSIC